MFFLISKTIGVMLIPSNFLIIVGSVGLILICIRCQSLGRKLLVVCVAGFVFCGFSPIGDLLLHPIETRFPAWNPKNGAPDGIVVLGGGIDRIIAAAKLARRYPEARIVYSGGNSSLIRSDDDVTEADVAEPIFVDLGLARDRLLLDRQSRNTQENAVLSKAIAAPKSGERWLLVTSALSYAAVDRHLSQSGICGRALSRQLENRGVAGLSGVQLLIFGQSRTH